MACTKANTLSKVKGLKVELNKRMVTEMSVLCSVMIFYKVSVQFGYVFSLITLIFFNACLHFRLISWNPVGIIILKYMPILQRSKSRILVQIRPKMWTILF